MRELDVFLGEQGTSTNLEKGFDGFILNWKGLTFLDSINSPFSLYQYALKEKKTNKEWSGIITGFLKLKIRGFVFLVLNIKPRYFLIPFATFIYFPFGTSLVFERFRW